ncbi:hypothetical protein LINGRAHAP2_LOCUS34617 [Linum grandiflorum]
MAPRRKNQKVDIPQTYVEDEQVVGTEAGGHGGGSLSNLAGEVAPLLLVSSVDLGGAFASLLQMMEENHKTMDEDRQLMVETGQSIEKSFNRSCSNIERKMDQLVEAVNENKKYFDELKRFLKPMTHSRAFPKDGTCLTPKNANGNCNVRSLFDRLQLDHGSNPCNSTHIGITIHLKTE